MTVYQSELSLRNKVARLVWGIAWTLAFRPSPRVCFAWRRWLVNRFGGQIAPGVKMYPSVRIWAPWNLAMAEGSILGDRVDCYTVAPITIGKGAIISQDTALCAATHDYTSPAFTLQPKPITIGASAWVATRAFVGPGVEIAEGAVVGACSVVVKNIPDWTVVAGNPARVIGKREKW